MTGLFVRIVRDGKAVSLELEVLTDEERQDLFKDFPRQKLINCIDTLCNWIKTNVKENLTEQIPAMDHPTLVEVIRRARDRKKISNE